MSDVKAIERKRDLDILDRERREAKAWQAAKQFPGRPAFVVLIDSSGTERYFVFNTWSMYEGGERVIRVDSEIFKQWLACAEIAEPFRQKAVLASRVAFSLLGVRVGSLPVASFFGFFPFSFGTTLAVSLSAGILLFLPLKEIPVSIVMKGERLRAEKEEKFLDDHKIERKSGERVRLLPPKIMSSLG